MIWYPDVAQRLAQQRAQFRVGQVRRCRVTGFLYEIVKVCAKGCWRIFDGKLRKWEYPFHFMAGDEIVREGI